MRYRVAQSIICNGKQSIACEKSTLCHYPPSRARFLLSSYIIGRSIALAITTLDAIVVAHVVMQSDWTNADGASIGVLVTLASLMLLVSIGLSTSLNRQHRAVEIAGSITKYGMAHSPLSLLQAGSEGDMERGETLQVIRRCRISFWGLTFSLIFVVLGFGIFIDSLLIKSHTIMPPTPTTMWGEYITMLSPIAIITLVLPFILSAMLVMPAILSGTWQRRLSIKADDTGITVQQSGKRNVTLRWDEIEYIIYSPARRVWPYPLAPFDGYYVIGNAHRFVTFNTLYGTALALQTNPLVRYQFDRGIDAFMIGIVRIIATIRARQGIEMHVPERLLARTSHLAKLWDATAEEDDNDETLPLSLIQPRADLVAQMEQTQATIMLRPRLKLMRIARKMLLYNIGIVVLLIPWWGGEAIANGVFHAHDKYYMLFQTRSEGIVLSSCLGGVLLLFGVWFSWTDARKERFTVIADEHGLTVFKGRGNEKRTAAWNTIKEWTMHPHGEDGSDGIVYIVHGRYILVWDESPKDTLVLLGGRRNETFQQRAEKLHAMIAAKTHLPLLSIPYEPRKRTWWRRLLATFSW